MVALFRIEKLKSGVLYVDGVDINTVPLATLRSRLGIIPQDPVMFSGSVRFNLDPFSLFSDAVIWSALEDVNMKAVVQSLPMKLGEMVAEGGRFSDSESLFYWENFLLNFDVLQVKISVLVNAN